MRRTEEVITYIFFVMLYVENDAIKYFCFILLVNALKKALYCSCIFFPIPYIGPIFFVFFKDPVFSPILNLAGGHLKPC